MLFLKKHAFCIKSELLNLDLKIIRFSSFTNFLFFLKKNHQLFAKKIVGPAPVFVHHRCHVYARRPIRRSGVVVHRALLPLSPAHRRTPRRRHRPQPHSSCTSSPAAGPRRSSPSSSAPSPPPASSPSTPSGSRAAAAAPPLPALAAAPLRRLRHRSSPRSRSSRWPAAAVAEARASARAARCSSSTSSPCRSPTCGRRCGSCSSGPTLSSSGSGSSRTWCTSPPPSPPPWGVTPDSIG